MRATLRFAALVGNVGGQTWASALSRWSPATFYLLLPLIGGGLGLDSSADRFRSSRAQYARSTMADVPGGVIVDAISRRAC